MTVATGLVGSRLTELLIAKNYKVIVLSRNANTISTNPMISYAAWNIEQQTIDVSAIEQADYIVHLAGAGVADKRWSKKRKNEILSSRTQSSALLVKALKENKHNIKALVSASAIGWYGPDPATHKNGFEENDTAATDFLGSTCQQWCIKRVLKPNKNRYCSHFRQWQTNGKLDTY